MNKPTNAYIFAFPLVCVLLISSLFHTQLRAEEKIEEKIEEPAAVKKMTYDLETERKNWEKWWANDGCLIARGRMIGIREYQYNRQDILININEVYISLDHIVAIKDVSPEKSRYAGVRIFLSGDQEFFCGVYTEGTAIAELNRYHRAQMALAASNYVFNQCYNKEVE